MWKMFALHASVAMKASEPPTHSGLVTQYSDRRERALEAPEGELDPLVRAALLREGAAHLGHQQRVGQDEHEREHDQPGEALRAVGRDRPERVEADERADGEEDHVEAPQRLDELRLLGEGASMVVSSTAAGVDMRAPYAARRAVLSKSVAPSVEAGGRPRAQRRLQAAEDVLGPREDLVVDARRAAPPRRRRRRRAAAPRAPRCARRGRRARSTAAARPRAACRRHAQLQRRLAAAARVDVGPGAQGELLAGQGGVAAAQQGRQALLGAQRGVAARPGAGAGQLAGLRPSARRPPARPRRSRRARRAPGRG